MKYADASTLKLPKSLQALIINNWDLDKKTLKKGLFINGKTGTGKTYALHAIRSGLKAKTEKSCSDIENWVELLFELKDKIRTGNLRDFMSELTKNHFIFIDDVGAEKQTEWSQEMLYIIVNRAYEYNKKLIMVTNLTSEEFTQKYGNRIASRITEMCEVTELKGVDRRLN
jgi:DNA replication protein DnaC